MNYQSKEALAKVFKEANGWSILEDGWELCARNTNWSVELECHSQFTEGKVDYPYINVKLYLHGRYKYMASFYTVKQCKEYIKSFGII